MFEFFAKKVMMGFIARDDYTRRYILYIHNNA